MIRHQPVTGRHRLPVTPVYSSKEETDGKDSERNEHAQVVKAPNRHGAGSPLVVMVFVAHRASRGAVRLRCAQSRYSTAPSAM